MYELRTDKPKALKRDCINIDMLIKKKVVRHLFTFSIKALAYTDIPARLAHFYAFCTNLLKKKDPKVINQRSWYIYKCSLV